jgi:hypothetical protein
MMSLPLLLACGGYELETQAYKNKVEITVDEVTEHTIMKQAGENSYLATGGSKNLRSNQEVSFSQVLSNNVIAIELATGCEVVQTSINHEDRSPVTTALVKC